MTYAEDIVDPDSYQWIVVLSAFFAFFAAFGIGANDVANAFATSVGSKAITIKQAVMLAAVFEFCGAVFMGSHVTKTVRKGISDYECFTENPGLLMYGCMCVIFCVGIWLIFATWLELPVSTTHSCVGGMIGMTLVARGAGCVNWAEEADLFPYVKGVAAIVISWVLSPVLSGICAVTLFGLCRQFVLRSDNSYQRSVWVYPLLILTTLVINIFFIIYKGAKGLELDETPLSTALGYSFGIGAGCAFISAFTVVPWVKKTVDAEWANKTDEEIAGMETAADNSQEMVAVDASKKTNLAAGSSDEVSVQDAGAVQTAVMNVGSYVADAMNTNPHDVIKTDERVGGIHANAETFDPKTEAVFRYLQVFTAICDSFAHGANDVANSIGPFAAVYVIYREGEVSKKAEMGDDAYWILAIGGFGIVIGLALYGYKIMQAIGVKLAKITPSRGFAIELGAALIIIIGSRLELPLSTTHCQVGATVGVSMLEGKKGVNWMLFGKVVAGWILTLAAVGFTVAIIFAQGVYAPCA